MNRPGRKQRRKAINARRGWTWRNPNRTEWREALPALVIRGIDQFGIACGGALPAQPRRKVRIRRMLTKKRIAKCLAFYADLIMNDTTRTLHLPGERNRAVVLDRPQRCGRVVGSLDVEEPR